MSRAALFLQPHYAPDVVALSLVVAFFASYVALDLARRVVGSDAGLRRAWIAGGGLVMGSGIWSMHFVGMLALQLPITLGYRPGTTLLSWLAAVAVSVVALTMGSRERLAWRSLVLGAGAMGAGICAMHYVGMMAIELDPGIVWDPPRVALSAAIAVTASAAALWLFFALRRLSGLRARGAQVLAAVLMGLAIGGMHYTGMTAASIPAGAVCTSAGGLGGASLATLILVAIGVLLALALFTSLVDSRRQARTEELAASLQATHQELLQANAELQRLAHTDTLTGIPNLTLFEARVAESLARAARRPQARVAVLFMDLDGFKLVNDSRGHADGDELLRQVARRMEAVCRKGDTIARIGGDEFVILLPEVAVPAEAAALAARLVRDVARPYTVNARELSITCSIGYSVHPDHGEAGRLRALADAAMYAAKRAGGNRAVEFDARFHSPQVSLELLQDLRQAVEQDALHLVYQPKVDVRSGRVRSVEALARWHHPERGSVPPDVFIPLAERSGLIVALGDRVLDHACRQIAAWAAQGRRLRVAVNLSAWQVRQPDIVDRIAGALDHHGADPGMLICEFTESVAMDDGPGAQKVIDRLGAMGVQLSFDDFGTGYSSLAVLRQLGVHELKVDRRFVTDLGHDQRARDLVEAVIKLAHALQMKVVAEGVETREQRDVLVALGCDELQGWLYARAMPPDELAEGGLFTAPGSGRLDFSPSVMME